MSPSFHLATPLRGYTHFETVFVSPRAARRSRRCRVACRAPRRGRVAATHEVASPDLPLPSRERQLVEHLPGRREMDRGVVFPPGGKARMPHDQQGASRRNGCGSRSQDALPGQLHRGVQEAGGHEVRSSPRERRPPNRGASSRPRRPPPRPPRVRPRAPSWSLLVLLITTVLQFGVFALTASSRQADTSTIGHTIG